MAYPSDSRSEPFIQSRYILYQAAVGQVVQIIKYDTETHLFRALTDDTGDKYSPYSWEAPELGGGRLFVAEAIPYRFQQVPGTSRLLAEVAG